MSNQDSSHQPSITSELTSQTIQIINQLVDDNPDASVWVKTAYNFYMDRNEKALITLLEKGSIIKTITRNVEENKKAKQKAVILSNILSSYYIHKLANESNANFREEYAQKTTTYINQAESISNQDTKIWLNKGFVLFLTGQYESARLHFDNILETENGNIEALYGKACVLYNMQNYYESLYCYQRILALNKQSCLKPRLGIALCLYKIGDIENAIKAIQRHLQLYPNDDVALAYSGVLSFQKYQKSGDDTLLQMSYQNFKSAFDINRGNELVMYYIALFQILNGYEKQAAMLVEGGLALIEKYGFAGKEGSSERFYSPDISKLASALHTLYGKIYLLNDKPQQAQKEFQIANALNKENDLAVFRLGQVSYILKSYADSFNYFQTLILNEKYSNDFALINYYAYTCAYLHKKQEAITYLKRILLFYPNDINALLTICQITENDNKTEAKVSYNEVIQITNLAKINSLEELNKNPYKEIIECAGPEILNNYACTLLSTGFSDDIKNYLKIALDLVHNDIIKISTSRKLAMTLIIRYNMGYFYEAKGSYADASEIYKSIIESYPSFISAYVRLSNMAMGRGNIRRMQDYIVKGMEKQANKSLAAKSQMAYNYLTVGNIKMAFDLFQSIMTDTNCKDKYAQLSLANIAYDNLKSQTSSVFQYNKNQNTEEIEVELKKIMSLYTSLLLSEEKNVYAAIGVANILAEFNKTEEAMEIYSIIREKEPHIPAAWINAAHLEVMNGKYISGASIYKRCLEKCFPLGEYDIELNLAKCYLAEKNYNDCLRVLKQLYIRYPNKIEIQYNLGVCSQLQAYSILSHAIQTVANITQAQSLIRMAIMLFDSVHSGEFAIAGRYHSESCQDLNRIAHISTELGKVAYEKKIVAEDQLKKSQSLHQKALERERHIEAIGKEIVQKETETSAKPIPIKSLGDDEELKLKLSKLSEDMKKPPAEKVKKRKKEDKTEDDKNGKEEDNQDQDNILDVDKQEANENALDSKEENDNTLNDPQLDAPKLKRLKKENNDIAAELPPIVLPSFMSIEQPKEQAPPTTAPIPEPPKTNVQS